LDIDCVVIVTDHSIYNWRRVSQTTAALVDTRHVVA
jgi:UDP-N-acetyl-D-mannosaminuronate dehydrogenase